MYMLCGPVDDSNPPVNLLDSKQFYATDALSIVTRALQLAQDKLQESKDFGFDMPIKLSAQARYVKVQAVYDKLNALTDVPAGASKESDTPKNYLPGSSLWSEVSEAVAPFAYDSQIQTMARDLSTTTERETQIPWMWLGVGGLVAGLGLYLWTKKRR